MDRSAAQVETLLGWMGSLADPTRLRLMPGARAAGAGCRRIVRRAAVAAIHRQPASEGAGGRGLGRLAPAGNGTGFIGWPRASLIPPHGVCGRWRASRPNRGPPCGRINCGSVGCFSEGTQPDRSVLCRAAAQWDRLRDELYGTAFTDQAMFALLQRMRSIADLGCGTGQIAAELAPWVAKVIGIDSSAAMLKAAKARTEESAQRRASPRRSDGDSDR